MNRFAAAIIAVGCTTNVTNVYVAADATDDAAAVEDASDGASIDSDLVTDSAPDSASPVDTSTAADTAASDTFTPVDTSADVAMTMDAGCGAADAGATSVVFPVKAMGDTATTWVDGSSATLATISDAVFARRDVAVSPIRRMILTVFYSATGSCPVEIELSVSSSASTKFTTSFFASSSATSEFKEWKGLVPCTFVSPIELKLTRLTVAASCPSVVTIKPSSLAIYPDSP